MEQASTISVISPTRPNPMISSATIPTMREAVSVAIGLRNACRVGERTRTERRWKMIDFILGYIFGMITVIVTVVLVKEGKKEGQE